MRHFIGLHTTAIEVLLVVAAAAVSFIFVKASQMASSCVSRLLYRLPRRGWVAVTLASMLPLVVRTLLLPLWGVPEPVVHDEFGYLLTADTMHSGRLSTPTHPMWVHFETPNFIQTPTYASVYTLAQSLFLLVGMYLGHPWAGVALSIALLCGALCWMLRQWFSPGWALFGALLFGIRFGIASYWMNSYWGGAPAALGAALVLGVWGKTLRRRRISPFDGLWLGGGLALLALSRPYEDLVLVLGIAASWFVSLHTKRFLGSWVPALLPALAIVFLAGSFFCFCNLRVTGSPFRIPYQVSRQQYGIPLVFIWERSDPGRSASVQAMKEYYEWLAGLQNRYHSFGGILRSLAGKISSFFMFYVGPLFCIPLLTVGRVFSGRRLRPLLLAGAIGMFPLLAEAWFFPHYCAAITPIFIAAIVQALRYLSTHPRWRTLVPAVPAIAIVMLFITIAAPNLSRWPISWSAPRTAPGVSRADVQRRLIHSGGRHLVIVRGQSHLNEWVFNGANIDASTVVWAHDLGPALNKEIINYYSDRHVWWISLEDFPPTLQPITFH